MGWRLSVKMKRSKKMCWLGDVFPDRLFSWLFSCSFLDSKKTGDMVE